MIYFVISFLSIMFGMAIGGLIIYKRESKEFDEIMNRYFDLERDIKKSEYKIEVFQGKNSEVSDKLLTELSDALTSIDIYSIDLPSFGTIDLTSRDRLKNIYQIALNTDFNIAH